jgi:uncharacterized protein
MNSTEKAQAGLNLIKDAIVSYLRDHPNGATNAEIVRELNLESDFEGENHNYLSWSVIGLLVNEGKVRYERRGRSRHYFGNSI